MDEWPLQQRLLAYDRFLRSGESIREKQSLFHLEVNVTVNILNKPPPDRACTTKALENIGKMIEVLLKSPQRFGQKSLRTILRKDLKFHSYKIQVVHLLNVRDYKQQKGFVVRMHVISDENKIIMRFDKVCFHLNGTVNKQNFCYCAP